MQQPLLLLPGTSRRHSSRVILNLEFFLMPLSSGVCHLFTWSHLGLIDPKFFLGLDIAVYLETLVLILLALVSIPNFSLTHAGLNSA
jgi:hypothetical protein